MCVKRDLVQCQKRPTENKTIQGRTCTTKRGEETQQECGGEGKKKGGVREGGRLCVREAERQRGKRKRCRGGKGHESVCETERERGESQV